MTEKARIWELDAFRGLCILGMVAVHLVFDLVELYGLVQWQYPAVFLLVRDWGGVLFLLISGICATLGSRSARRGTIVFFCGLLCTAVTFGMYALKLADRSIVILFGVLHCLGVCMLVWPLFRRLPGWALAVLGGILALAGLYLRGMVVDFSWLFFLGLTPTGFQSGDYFPLLPNLGFFLLGAALGKTCYREKRSRLPRVNTSNPCLRLLCFCGRQSLPIYLLHQPILAGILGLAAMLKP